MAQEAGPVAPNNASGGRLARIRRRLGKPLPTPIEEMLQGFGNVGSGVAGAAEAQARFSAATNKVVLGRLWRRPSADSGDFSHFGEFAVAQPPYGLGVDSQ